MIEETWLIPYLSQAVDTGGTELAVDVGANVGTWSELLSKHYDDVIAVEPDDRASDAIPEIRNVEVVRGAISDFNGTCELHLRPQPFQNSLLKDHPIDATPPVGKAEILCQTLDVLCPDGADFVKMDIEGGEVSALRGCASDGRWDRTHFIVECHDNFTAVGDELRRLGKRVEKVPHTSVGAHPGHCWAIGTPDDPTEPVV